MLKLFRKNPAQPNGLTRFQEKLQQITQIEGLLTALQNQFPETQFDLLVRKGTNYTNVSGDKIIASNDPLILALANQDTKTVQAFCHQHHLQTIIQCAWANQLLGLLFISSTLPLPPEFSTLTPIIGQVLYRLTPLAPVDLAMEYRAKLWALCELLEIGRHDLNYPLNIDIFRALETLTPETLEETKNKIIQLNATGMGKLNKIVEIAKENLAADSLKNPVNISEAIQSAIQCFPQYPAQLKVKLAPSSPIMSSFEDLQLAIWYLIKLGFESNPDGQIKVSSSPNTPTHLIITYSFPLKNLDEIKNNLLFQPVKDFLSEKPRFELLFIKRIIKNMIKMTTEGTQTQIEFSILGAPQ